MLQSGVEWVLFDAVGTLIYPDPPVADAYHSVAYRHGSRLTSELISVRFRNAFSQQTALPLVTSEALERDRWRRIVAHVFDDVPSQNEAIFDELWDHFANSRHWRLYEDVPHTLANLRNHGYKVGIASNLDQRLRQIIAGHDELCSCDEVFISSEVGYAKPHLQFFRAVEKRLNASAASIALVGDDEVNDYQGALAAGWQSIWLCRDLADGPSTAIRSLHELL
jgi:putative hydrolase of the HAD superfamily